MKTYTTNFIYNFSNAWSAARVSESKLQNIKLAKERLVTSEKDWEAAYLETRDLAVINFTNATAEEQLDIALFTLSEHQELIKFCFIDYDRVLRNPEASALNDLGFIHLDVFSKGWELGLTKRQIGALFNLLRVQEMGVLLPAAIKAELDENIEMINKEQNNSEIAANMRQLRAFTARWDLLTAKMLKKVSNKFSAKKYAHLKLTQWINKFKIDQKAILKVVDSSFYTWIMSNNIKAITRANALKSIVIDSQMKITTTIKDKVMATLNKSAKVFFNLITNSFITPGHILNFSIASEVISKFWFEVVIPASQKEGLDTVALQMKFKTDSGEWRSMGPFTSWHINNIDGFMKFIENWINVLANHYAASGIIINQFDFTWKLLTYEDDILRLKTSNMANKAILDVRNFNKLANAIPLTFDYKSILGSIAIGSPREDKWFLQSVAIKGVLGLDMVLTNWQIEPIYLSGQLQGNTVTVFMQNSLTPIAKFTDIINGDSIERRFSDGSTLIFENQKIKEHIAHHDANQVMMQNTRKVTWLDKVINENLFTFDIETRATPMKRKLERDGSNATNPYNIELAKANKANPNFNINKVAHWIEYVTDAAGNPLQQLSIISLATFTANFKDYFNLGSHRNESDFLFINDFKDEASMTREFFNRIRNLVLERKININLAAHNSAKFDLIFLLKYLIEFAGEHQDKLDFLQRDNKILAVDWKVNTGQSKLDHGKIRKVYHSINLFDSFLMLPMSLEKAAQQFQVENKGNLDFTLLNKNFSNPEEFTDYIESMRGAIKDYNIQDCRVLWYVLAHYAKNTAERFNVNIFKHPTAASIAFATFKANYLEPKEHMIPITSKIMYDTLSPAYMGGACDVYKPTNPEDSKVYTYDINSEYPAMMATKLMPTGYYTHVKGNIDIENPELIAFVRAKIIAPENLKVPLLPMNVNGKMVVGAGTFEGLYFSKELNYALSLGYIIEATEAYVFEGRLVFDKFITDLYSERLTYKKDNPMNYICKLIMNSTYGRFGMAPILTDVNIFSPEDATNFPDSAKILNITNINENLVMVTSQHDENIELNTKSAGSNLQISLPIAAAITSYARICIHEYKLAAAEAGTLLYSDTDSIITSAPIDESMVGPELGRIKLETVADEGVFLAPKVYALRNVIKDPMIIDGVIEGGTPMGDIIKAKGIKSPKSGGPVVEFRTIKRLLNKKEVFAALQPKWFRSVAEASITIKNMTSLLRINEGKRVIVTNLQDQFIDTLNIIFQDGNIISPNVVKLGLPVPYIEVDDINFKDSTRAYFEAGALDPFYLKDLENKAAKSLADEAAADERAKIIEEARMFNSINNMRISDLSLVQLRMINKAIATEDSEILSKVTVDITGLEAAIYAEMAVRLTSPVTP